MTAAADTKPRITAGQRKALNAIATAMNGEHAESFHVSVRRSLEAGDLIRVRVDAGILAHLVGCNSCSPGDFDLTEAGAAAIGLEPAETEPTEAVCAELRADLNALIAEQVAENATDRALVTAAHERGRALAACTDCSTPVTCTGIGCVEDRAEPEAVPSVLPIQPGEIAAFLDTVPPTPIALRHFFNDGWPGFEVRFLAAGYGHRAGEIANYGRGSVTLAGRIPDGWDARLDAARDRHAAFWREEPSTVGLCCCQAEPVAPMAARPAMVPMPCQQWQADASRYGAQKPFKTSAGLVFAETRAEVATKAKSAAGSEPTFVQGPSITPSLRELGVRAQVRRMNRAGL